MFLQSYSHGKGQSNYILDGALGRALASDLAIAPADRVTWAVPCTDLPVWGKRGKDLPCETIQAILEAR